MELAKPDFEERLSGIFQKLTSRWITFHKRISKLKDLHRKVENTCPSIPSNHLDLLLLDSISQPIFLQVLDRPVDEFGDMVDPDYFTGRSYHVVKDCGKIA